LSTDPPELVPGKFTFGTLGEKAEEIRLVDEKLSMNGPAVVKFVKRYIPADIRNNIELNGLTMDEIDKFLSRSVTTATRFRAPYPYFSKTKSRREIQGTTS